MATYRFTYLNDGLDIVDPAIEFPTLVSWDRDTKIGVIQCILTTPNGSVFSAYLDNISLPAVNGGTMDAKGQQRLNDFEI